MLQSPLGWNFFGLSSNYIPFLNEEYFYLAKYLRMQYSEFLHIPTYVRKYLINKLVEDLTQNKIQT
jgi:hypothetical protein